MSSKSKVSSENEDQPGEAPPCNKCGNPGKFVWVLPDSYGGYGHCVMLYCANCKPTNPSQDSKHEYNPDIDDFFLGRTKDEPLDWSSLGTCKAVSCYDCKALIPPDQKIPLKDGSGFRYGYNKIGDGEKVGKISKKFLGNLYFCQRHFRLRKGDGTVTVEEE